MPNTLCEKVFLSVRISLPLSTFSAAAPFSNIVVCTPFSLYSRLAHAKIKSNFHRPTSVNISNRVGFSMHLIAKICFFVPASMSVILLIKKSFEKTEQKKSVLSKSAQSIYVNLRKTTQCL